MSPRYLSLGLPPTDPPNNLPQNTVKRARQAIVLLALVVLFNLVLYELIFLLARYGDPPIIPSGSSFPAFVLFLSFTLSIGIILIVGLGERVDASKTDNVWVKRIGITPIMTIVAVLITILASFSGLGEKIIPSDPELRLKFMLANVGVTCVARESRERKSTPEASKLLAVIYSPEKKYIKTIEEFLVNKDLISKATSRDFELIKPGSEDEKTLKQFARRSQEKGSESLKEDLETPSNWIGYGVRVKDPVETTPIAIPAVFDGTLKTRLFVAFRERFPTDTRPELASLDASIDVSRVESPRVEILPLFQLNIGPNRPRDLTQVTNLDLKIFTGHSCWHIGL